MDKIHEWVNTGLILLVALLGLVGGNHQSVDQRAGSVTTGSAFPHGVSIGLAVNSPTNVAEIHTGTCALIYTNSSIIASSSTAFDCAVTGIVSTDVVFAQTSTTTAAAAGWAIVGASASSTAGYITFNIVNNTGATGNIPRNIASSTPYLVIKTQ